MVAAKKNQKDSKGREGLARRASGLLSKPVTAVTTGALERAGGDRRDRLGKQPRRTARQTFPTLGILLVLLRCNHGAAPSLVFELDFRSHVTR